MARKTKPALPGQSRSSTCRSKTCQRLQGHKGEHRGTLTTRRPAAPAAEPTTTKTQAGTSTKARRPKVVVIPMADYRRVVAAGIKVRRSRRYIVSERPSARLA